MARSPIPSEERIFSLVLALLASAEGLTKQALLSSVYGYAERFRDPTQAVALDRQFERDKVQLRSLGIPIDTIDAPGEPGNNQLARYRISREAFEVPEGLRFNDRELMLLRMAVLAWREGSLSEDSRRASMKVESLGGGTRSAGADAQQLVSAGFGASEPSAPALLAAIEERKVAEFDYQLPGRDAPLARRVYPLQLHRFEGRWHLIAWDLDRNASRVFLLSRVSGIVRRRPARTARDAEAAWPENAAEMISQAVHELHDIQRTQLVTVRVRPHSIAEAELTSRAVEASTVEIPENQLTIGTTDLHEMAPYLAGFGGDVEVLDPPALRDAVVALLRMVGADHVGGQHG